MSSWTTYRAKVASLSRSRESDDPELIAARQNLKTARLADRIQVILESVPPLRPEQIESLTALLRAGNGGTR